MSNIGSRNKYSISCVTPQSVNYVPPLRSISMNKEAAGGNNRRMNLTSNVNYNAYMYSSPCSSRLDTGRGRFVSQSMGDGYAKYLFPASNYIEDTKHIANLSRIKAGINKDFINKAPVYKSPQSLNSKMKTKGGRYINMGAKAKQEEISRKLGQTNTTGTSRDLYSRNKANRIHLDDISKLSMINASNDGTTRIYDYKSVISSMGGGNPQSERQTMDFGKYRSSLPIIEYDAQSFIGENNIESPKTKMQQYEQSKYGSQERRAEDFFCTNKSIDWNIHASRESIESVKPRQYYMLTKEPYLQNNSNLIKDFKTKQGPENEWKPTNEEAKKWKVDLKPIEEKTLTQKKSFKDSIKKEKLILAIFNNRKDKSTTQQALNELKHDKNLKKMVENDPLFKSQLKNATNDTIYTINKLFIDIDQQYHLKPIETKQLTQKEKLMQFKQKLQTTVKYEEMNRKLIENTNLKSHEINMIEELGKARIVIEEKKQKKRIIYCEDSDDDRLKGPMIGEGNKSTQKIRKMIQKHFMTGLPWSIAQEKVVSFDFCIIQRLGNWKRGMENSLDDSTLGQSYLNLRQNMFGIGYLERMQQMVGDEKAIVKGNLDEIFENNKAKSQNMEKLFYNQTTKETFYDQIKNRNPMHLGEKEEAIQNYYNQLQKIPSMIPKPSFLKIEDNWIKLSEETIPDIQAQLLKQYFTKTKDMPDKQVLHMMTDSCYMSDISFATLLQGIQAQKDTKGNSLLQTLIFTNGKLGQSSAKAIIELMPGIRELSINNIQGNLNKNIARNIIESIIVKGPKLQKLRLSAINLNDEKTMQQLCMVLEMYQGDLQSINLSNASLTPKYLSMISEELKKAPFWIKKLDLSYNTLNFTTNPSEIEHSKKFVKDMCIFFELTDLLNHLDISGMNFDSHSLIQICEKMATCPNLMAIHLNDQHLLDSRNQDLLREIFCIFKLEENESICRGKQVMKDLNNDTQIQEMLTNNHKQEQEENKIQKEQNIVEMFKLSLQMSIMKELQKKELQMHNQLNIEKLQETKNGLVQIKAIQERNRLMLETIAYTERQYKIDRMQNSSAQSDQEKQQIISQKNYKNQVMMVKQNTLIKQNKIELKSKAGQGIGRDHGNQVDAFVLTRRVNNPELIWNQNPYLDSNHRQRFFQVDASYQWELSQKNECFICDGHKYTIIFFQQGLLTKYNKGLYEIKDQNVLNSFENHYRYNYSKGHVYAPIIFGSVVGGNDHQFPYAKLSFERKLRMMRVELYSTLLITNSSNFMQNNNDSFDIKSGIVEFSNKDKIGALQKTTILNKISDWQDILYDKCQDNYLTDVHVENATPNDFENFNDATKNKNMFVYATYLVPGIHKFVIYCPISKRAFCKTIMVDVNTKDQYPEFPTQYKANRRKLIMNVWRKCRNEDKQFHRQVCSKDIDHPLFDLSLIIKDDQAINVVKDMIRTNWKVFYLNFIEKMISENGINSYPDMNYHSAMSYADSDLNDAFTKVPLIVEQMEIQFIRCCRNQQVKGITGQLRRFEFIEYFVRIGKSSFPLMAPSFSLLIYISLFLKPIADKSTFLHERELIRASMPLNKSLHENRGGLTWIFNKLKEPNEMVGKTIITNYIRELLKSYPQFDSLNLHATFIYSLEIIVDDVADASKYWYMTYTEYQEFICRIALILYKDTKGENKEAKYEYKVCDLIKIMYEDEGILDPLQAKLKCPDEDISFQPINDEEQCC